MENVIIRRPTKSDVMELGKLFDLAITDAFRREGIGDKIEDIQEEVAKKIELIHKDLDSNGKDFFFLIAVCGTKIVGTVSFGPCGRSTRECSKGRLADVGEIGTIYVLPAYQRQGIGTLLLNSMLLVLLGRGVLDFCLDSGYPTAQRVWQNKLGEPSYVVRDYWGEGFDHMVWHRRVKDTVIRFSIG